MSVDDLWFLSRPQTAAAAHLSRLAELGNVPGWAEMNKEQLLAAVLSLHDGRVPSSRHGRGRRYRVRVDDPNGVQPTKSFDTLREAQRYDRKIHGDIDRGEYVDPADAKITVREYSEKWIGQQIHALSTEELVERSFRLHVWPILGDLPMGKVRRSDIQSWVKDRSQEGVLAASTLHIVYGYVATMFKAAVIDKAGLHVTPCRDIKLPELDDDDRYIPTPREVAYVADELPAYYRAAVYLAAGCGLRAQEIFGLELEHIDWLRREVKVRQQIGQATGYPRFVGKLKTKTSRRDVELPAPTQEALSRLVALKPPVARRLLDRRNPRKPVERDVTLLFTTSNGAPVNRSGWSRVWRGALKRADARARAEGVARGEKDPMGVTQGWGLHALRHFFATGLIHRGASVKTVQMALGHSKPTITLDTYTHDWPDAQERTRTLIEDALRLDASVAASGSTSASS